MTKKEFIEKLEAELKDETYSTVTQVMTYYEEIIADLMEDGYSEEDAVSKLGSIQEAVANVKGTEDVIEIKKMKTTTSAWVSVLLVLGFPLWGSLMAAGLCLLLSAYILIWCVPIITVALEMAGSVGFIVGIFGSFPLFVQSLSLGITQLGVSAIFGAIGLIGIALTSRVSGTILANSKKMTICVKDCSIQMLRKVGFVC